MVAMADARCSRSILVLPFRKNILTVGDWPPAPLPGVSILDFCKVSSDPKPTVATREFDRTSRSARYFFDRRKSEKAPSCVGLTKSALHGPALRVSMPAKGFFYRLSLSIAPRTL